MRKILLTALFVGLLACLSRSTFGQTSLHRIYKVEQADGRVAIFGINQEVVPYSVLLEVRLTHMQSSVPLPDRIVMLPGEAPQLLTILTPDRPNYSYNYKYLFDVGIYTGHAPDSTTAYSLPFQATSDTIKTRQRFKHQYTFYLPIGTPVVAAREGVVAYVRHNRKSSRKRKKANLILVYHSDGTCAAYANITQNSAAVKVGQQVNQGDVLGRFGGNKYNSELWFSVIYPTKLSVEGTPVTFYNGKGTISSH